MLDNGNRGVVTIVFDLIILFRSWYSLSWRVWIWCSKFEVDVDVRRTVAGHNKHSASKVSSKTLKYRQTGLRLAFNDRLGVIMIEEGRAVVMLVVLPSEKKTMKSSIFFWLLKKKLDVFKTNPGFCLQSD